MNTRVVLDVSGLSDGSVDYKSPIWWGNVIMLISESMVLAMGIAAYFFYRMRYTEWPPADAGPPDAGIAVLNLAVILLICVPAARANRLARDAEEWRLARIVGLCSGLAALTVVIRVFEFGTLNTMWYEHSYGSVVYALLGLHGLHLLIATFEFGLVALYAATHSMDPHHRTDVKNAVMYWYFNAVSGVVVFAVLQGGGRAL